MTKGKTRLIQVLEETGVAEIIEKNNSLRVAESMFLDGITIENISKHTSIPVNELIEHFNTINHE